LVARSHRTVNAYQFLTFTTDVFIDREM